MEAIIEKVNSSSYNPGHFDVCRVSALNLNNRVGEYFVATVTVIFILIVGKYCVILQIGIAYWDTWIKKYLVRLKTLWATAIWIQLPPLLST